MSRKRPLYLIGATLLSAAALLLGMWWNIDDSPRPSNLPPTGLDPRFDMEIILLPGQVGGLAFSPDGRFLAAGSKGTGSGKENFWNGVLKVREVDTGKELHSILHEQWVAHLEFDPAGRYLAAVISSSNPTSHAGFFDFVEKPGEIRVYEFPAMREVLIRQYWGQVEEVKFSTDGNRLGVFYFPDSKNRRTGDIEVFPLDDPENATVFSGKTPGFVFAPDGRTIIVGERDDRFPGDSYALKVLDAFDGTVLRTLGEAKNQRLPPAVQDIAPDGTLLLVFESGVLLYDFRKDEFVEGESRQFAFWRAPGNQGFHSARFSSDKRYILATTAGHALKPKSKVMLEDLRDKELIHVFGNTPSKAHFTRCAFSPDNRIFAVGTTYRGVGPESLRGEVLLFRRKDGG